MTDDESLPPPGGHGPPESPPPPPPPSFSPPAGPAPPPPSGWAPPGGPPAWTDPRHLGAAVGRLSPGARKRGRVALLVAAALLGDEWVEAVVQGRVHGFDGAAVLTSARLVVVNSREWQPDVVSLVTDGELSVQGWQDDRTAALVIQRRDQSVAIDGIDDRALAVEFAHRLRTKAL